jgi:N-acetyl-gamma-glutamyl-phosphate reductase
MNAAKIAVVGASGYSGEELLRLLGGHPGVDIVCVTSRQHKGRPLFEVQPAFHRHLQLGSLHFSDATVEAVTESGAELAFLALPHGLAAEFAEPLLAAGVRVVDLSADFRIRDADVFKEFYGENHPAPELLQKSVYGLPEIYREKIRGADLVASPGCYPTSILLPLIPLLREKLIEPGGIVANSMSGVTGAGRKADVTFLFAECNESVRAYGLPKHRHLSEIEQELSIAASETIMICFHPHLMPVNRGIHTTITARAAHGTTETLLRDAFEEMYGSEPFIRLISGFPDVKHVTRSNYLDLTWRLDVRTNTVVLLSAEDNLVKGAGGQAIQSMNLMLGMPETTGLL